MLYLDQEKHVYKNQNLIDTLLDNETKNLLGDNYITCKYTWSILTSDKSKNLIPTGSVITEIDFKNYIL